MKLFKSYEKPKPTALIESTTLKHFDLQLNEIEINTIIAALSQVTPSEITMYGVRKGIPTMGYKESSTQVIEGMEYWKIGYGHESLIRFLESIK